jgi:hypothetical protein
MTPMEYATRYLNIQVPAVKDDQVAGWQSVRLDRYVLITSRDEAGKVYWDSNHAGNQAAHDALLGKLMGHFAKKGATLTVHVKEADGTRSHVEFDAWREVWYYARKALFGKGCPEDAAVTLQLAARFGLAPGGDLQAYCDKYLGLDCNGFVGNYLVHGLRGKDWDTGEPPWTANLADTTIDVIVRKNGTAVTTVDDLLPTGTYLLALVGASGRVIPQVENGTFGHILITQPGQKWESDYLDDKKGSKVWTMYSVESTGGVGLVTAACQLVGVTADGIFTVKRRSHPLMAPLRFRAFRVL